MSDYAEIVSFSFAMGQDNLVKEYTAIYDCRHLPDPQGKGVGSDGTDVAVQNYVFRNSPAAIMVADALDVLAKGGTVAFGCHAGKNRSVSLAEVTFREALKAGFGESLGIEHLGQGYFW